MTQRLMRLFIAGLFALGVGSGTVAEAGVVLSTQDVIFEGPINFCVDSGTTDAYACSLGATLRSYNIGAQFSFKANTANTGAATLNLNQVGAKTIKKLVAGVVTDLADNDIAAGQIVTVQYDGTNFQMQSTVGNAGGGAGTVTTTGSPASSQVSFFTGAASISGDSNLTWDNTAKTLSLGTGNAVTITNATLTGARTFTLPDANSNPVVPSTCAANNLVNGVSSAGVLGCVTAASALAGFSQITGVLGGICTAPPYAFNTATTTGLASSNGFQIYFCVNNAASGLFQAGQMAINGTSTALPAYSDYATDSNGISFPGSNNITMSSNGLEETRWAPGEYRLSHGSADAVGYAINFLKARGTVAAPTVITTGDAIVPLCGKVFVGATNTYLKVACIEFDSTGTIADTTSGAGGTIKFQTTKAGTDTVVQTAYTITGGSTPTHTFVGTIIPTSTTGIQGTTTNDSTSAGSVGEYVTATIATGSSVTLTTNTTANVTSISLTAGDWDVTCAVDFTFGATTSYTNLVGGVSTTSATLGGQDTKFDFETPAAVPTAGADSTFVCPVVRQSLSGTTTVYLVAQGTFTVSTLKAYGTIRARRVR